MCIAAENRIKKNYTKIYFLLYSTVVATNMNATSSRSHTIVSIGLDQKRTTQNGEITITSVVNIVDLAGRYK